MSKYRWVSRYINLGDHPGVGTATSAGEQTVVEWRARYAPDNPYWRILTNTERVFVMANQSNTRLLIAVRQDP